MATGEVHTVMSSVMRSFKVATSAKISRGFDNGRVDGGSRQARRRGEDDSSYDKGKPV